MPWMVKRIVEATIITITLSLLVIFPFGILAVLVYSSKNGRISSLPLAYMISVLALSIISQLFAAYKFYLVFRTISPDLWHKSWAFSILQYNAIRMLIIIWLLLSCLGVVLSIKQPLCNVPRSDVPRLQQSLLPCNLHKLVVAAVIATLILEYVQFCLSATEAPHDIIKSVADSAGSISSLSRTSTAVDDGEQLYMIPERHPKKLQHDQWLQRRNSLSSQKAIYPYEYCLLENRPRPSSRSSSYGYAPSSRYTSSLDPVNEQSLPYSFKPSSSSSLRTMLSSWSNTNQSIQGGFGLRCSSIPESCSVTELAIESSNLPLIPPPAWCPPLQHAPLSADPAIRALSSTEKLISPSQPSTHTLLPSRRMQALARRTSSNRTIFLNTGTKTALRRPSPIGHRYPQLSSQHGSLVNCGRSM